MGKKRTFDLGEIHCSYDYLYTCKGRDAAKQSIVVPGTFENVVINGKSLNMHFHTGAEDDDWGGIDFKMNEGTLLHCSAVVDNHGENMLSCEES